MTRKLKPFTPEEELLLWVLGIAAGVVITAILASVVASSVVAR